MSSLVKSGKILAVDCALKGLTLSIVEEGKILASHAAVHAENHSLTLLKEIDQLLLGNKIALTDLQQIIFSHGPGGFTSLRVGLATIQGLFFGVDIPVLSVSSLFLRCLAHETDQGAHLVLLRAGHSNLYVGYWQSRQRQYFEDFFSSEQLKQKLQDEWAPTWIGGEGAELLRDFRFIGNQKYVDPMTPNAFLHAMELMQDSVVISGNNPFVAYKSLDVLRLSYCQPAVL